MQVALDELHLSALNEVKDQETFLKKVNKNLDTFTNSGIQYKDFKDMEKNYYTAYQNEVLRIVGDMVEPEEAKTIIVIKRKKEIY